MLLKINGTEYSKKLLSSYNVNEYRTYSEWIDGNMKKHKELTRVYVKGTLKITLTEEEFVKFTNDLQAVKDDKLYSIEVYVNNLLTTKSISAYLEFYPTMRKDTTTGKIYDDISISLEEM